jgi:hypothetical protein
MTTRTAWLAAGLSLALAGCGAGTIYRNYTSFVTHFNQEDLDVLDAGGQDGARLIVGMIELDGTWSVKTDASGAKVVEIESLRIARRTEYGGKVIEAPPETVRGPWRVCNPYVVHWAEKRGGAR